MSCFADDDDSEYVSTYELPKPEISHKPVASTAVLPLFSRDSAADPHPSTEGATVSCTLHHASSCQRTSDGATAAVQTTTNDLGIKRQRSISFDDKPHVMLIDRSSKISLQHQYNDEANDDKNSSHRLQSVANARRTDEMWPTETQNDASSINNGGEKVGFVHQNNRTVYIDYSTTDGSEKLNHRQSTRHGSGTRCQRSPHPKWLSSALAGRGANRLTTMCYGINRHSDFVPVAMSDDDDSGSVNSCSSDGSLIQETVYDDYGWHCVTAV